jgi:hypothetical protein
LKSKKKNKEQKEKKTMEDKIGRMEERRRSVCKENKMTCSLLRLLMLRMELAASTLIPEFF